MKTDRKQYNSTLRPVSLKRQRELQSGAFKPKPRAPIKRPTLEEMKERGLVGKASAFTAKPRKRIKARANPKPGQQSQPEFFKEIWSERPHVSEVSGLPLIPMPDDWEDEAHVRAWLSQFSHILAKGQYRKFKDRKDNIVLKTRAEHEFWEKNKPNSRNAYMATPAHKRVGTHDGWMICDRLYIALRNEANGIT